MEGGAPSAADRPSLRAEWPIVAGLAAWFAVAAVAVRALRDVPLIDDWTYAWSVEHLLRRGELEVLDWSAVIPVGHAMWGAAWSAVLGFSFGTLRISTLVLGAVASIALYLILRELEAQRRTAFLGAFALAGNPVFLVLASSFMTDVPFVAFTLLSLLGYVRAVHRDDPRQLWWAGLWACLSCLDRQVGVLTPLAGLPLVLKPPGPRITRLNAAAALAATWIAMVVGAMLVDALVGATSEMQRVANGLQWLLTLPLATYVTYTLYVASAIAFYALPALIGMAAAREIWRGWSLPIAIAVMAALMLGVAGEMVSPMRPGNTWNLREVGGARRLLHGTVPLTAPEWVDQSLRALGLLATALAVSAVLRRVSFSTDVPRSVATLASTARETVAAVASCRFSARAPLIVYLAMYIGLINVLWFYNDRYALITLPVLMALALGRRTVPPFGAAVAWAFTVVFAVVALVGTRDTLRLSQAVGDTRSALVARGVHAADIDAGYTWNGWALYAHPERMHPGQTQDDVPWVTSKRMLPYVIAKAPIEGYDVESEVAWDDGWFWPGPDRLFVLKAHAPHRPHTIKKPAG